MSNWLGIANWNWAIVIMLIGFIIYSFYLGKPDLQFGMGIFCLLLGAYYQRDYEVKK